MPGKPWRLARSLVKLRAQIDALSPKRNRKSDGDIGDTSHSARKSDHNPDARGIVHAIDITHDPEHGCNAASIAEELRKSHDPRILNVIWNRRIFSSRVRPWVWRPYEGENPHDKHVHVSVTVAGEDDQKPWSICPT